MRRATPDRTRCLALACFCAVAVVGAVPAGGAIARAEPRAQPGIEAVVAALSSHPVVAIAESHGLTQAGDFYVALVRDPGFQRVAQDIVIEFASRQSQPLLDRYVVDGDSLPLPLLRSIWRNTTKVGAWEYPIYSRWLTEVRDVNRTLPRARRIRVLAGDTAVDWLRLHGPSDWAALGENNISFASVILDSVIARHRHALVVLGSNHLTRGGDRNGGPNTATRVEARSPGALFVVWLYTGRPGGDDVDARIARELWPRPSLIPLRGSWIGDLRAGTRRLANLADALLYVAPARELSVEEAPAESFDSGYAAELDRRSWIEWGDSTRARRFLRIPARR